MKIKELGFTLLEVMIAIGIMAVAGTAAGMAIYQVIGGTEDNSDHMTVVQQVQNTGYWVSRDVQMAVSINATGNVTFPTFLQCGWTEWDAEGSAVYHQTEYTLTLESNDLYTLKRNHTSSEGADEQMIVARHIYFDLNSENTTSAIYVNPNLVLNVTSIYEASQEIREYRVKKRTGL